MRDEDIKYIHELQMIIGVLIKELKDTQQELITTAGITDEKVVQHYLNGIYKNIDELVIATEKALEDEK